MPSAPAPFIDIERVTKTFQADPRTPPIAVIDDVSIAVDKGEFVVFLGPSGCGKTTLMRMVGGLETPTRGRVLIDGEPVERARAGRRAWCSSPTRPSPG